MKSRTASLIVLSLLACAFHARAAVFLTVTGGQSNTPLNITINTGDTFTASETVTSNLFVVFENFWNNNFNQISATGATETVSLGGTTTSNSTGSTNSGSWTSNDLVLGFGSTSITSGNAIVLSTGVRITGSNLSLDHTLINDSGNVKVYRTVNNVVSDTLTWTTVVPEPGTHAMLGSICCLAVFFLYRRPRQGVPCCE